MDFKTEIVTFLSSPPVVQCEQGLKESNIVQMYSLGPNG